MVLYVAQLTLLALAVALALWRGGWPERAIAAIMAAWVVIDRAFHIAFPAAETYVVVDLWHLGADSVGLALFLVVALRADRIWPLWVCSLQLISVVGHILRLLDERMFELVYAIFLRFPFWLSIFLLIWGSLHQAWRRNAQAQKNGGRGKD